MMVAMMIDNVFMGEMVQASARRARGEDHN